MILGLAEVSAMSELFLLSERQMARISPHFPRSHGRPRVDDRRVISEIIYVIRNGLRWKDAPQAYARIRRCIIASFAGADAACSSGYSPRWPVQAPAPTGS